ncbi:MAG: phosphonopyruvate decarboxylase [Promethearchaeia archaeon]|nr:MAG: phosphonopyruvate decarboxylase [Candidatus Lokiarchaeia archaeon]
MLPFNLIREKNINFFTGVPDSTLQAAINFLNTDLARDSNVIHIRAVNECESIALSAGYFLGTNQIGMVYMQNSGLGKAVNPLTSLVDPQVFSIPILLLIGWRGEPGKPDDPQHMKMGQVMLPILNDLEIPYSILENDEKDLEIKLNTALRSMKERSAPYALICTKEFFDPYPDNSENTYHSDLTCELAIDHILNTFPSDTAIISTTGRISRALYHLRAKRNEKHREFYTLGSMGCASAIGLGLSKSLEAVGKRILVIDGDGAALMQLGHFSSIGNQAPQNFYHILIDNNSYCSTGCQPSISESVDFAAVAKACGYRYALTVDLEKFLKSELPCFLETVGPSLLVIKVKRGRKKYLHRLQSPLEYKKNFQIHLNL